MGKRRQVLTRTRVRAALDPLQARRSRTSSCSARSRARRRRRRPRSSARSRPSRRRTSSSSTTPTTPRRCSRASRSTRSTRPSAFVRSRDPPPRARRGAPDALLVPWGRRREVLLSRVGRAGAALARASSSSVVGLVVVVAPAQRSHVGARRPVGAQVPARRARARERGQARLPHHVGRADRRGGLRGGAQRLALGRAGVCVCVSCVCPRTRLEYCGTARRPSHRGCCALSATTVAVTTFTVVVAGTTTLAPDADCRQLPPSRVVVRRRRLALCDGRRSTRRSGSSPRPSRSPTRGAGRSARYTRNHRVLTVHHQRRRGAS